MWTTILFIFGTWAFAHIIDRLIMGWWRGHNACFSTELTTPSFVILTFQITPFSWGWFFDGFRQKTFQKVIWAGPFVISRRQQRYSRIPPDGLITIKNTLSRML